MGDKGGLEALLSRRGNFADGGLDEARLAGPGAAGVGDANACSEKGIERRFAGGDDDGLALPVERGHGLFPEDVGAGGFSEGGDFTDERGGDAEFGEARAEVFDDRIEVRVVKAAGDQMGVTTAQVLAGVSDRPSEDHGEESLLFGDLSVHVDSFEKVRDARVGEDFAVEEIDGGFDGGGTA